MGKVKVNFKADDKVIEEMKIHCIKAKVEYQEFIEQAIVEKLKRKAK